jgi:hypothetical protein
LFFVKKKYYFFNLKGRKKLLTIMKQITKILTLMLFVGVIFSCDDTDDSDDMDGNNTAPTADAGDDITITLGETVTLDGGNSSDDDNDPLSYSWELTSQPSGSSVSIDNNENVQVQFIPDVAGSYTATLTVSDDDDSDDSDDETSKEDTDEVLITVEEPEQQTVIVDSDVTEDTVWEDIYDDETPDYRVTNSISVEAALTINPGVIVEFDEDVNFFIAAEGTLISEGDTGNKIIMTSSNEEGEVLWKGIEIVSTLSNNSISNTEIKYAGGAEYTSFADFVDVPAAIAIHSNGRLNLNNTLISESGGYGMYVRFGELLSFSENSFENNSNAGLGVNLTEAVKIDGATTFTNNQHAVEIYGSGITESSETTLSKLDGTSAYYVSGNLSIESVFNIEAGAFLEMAEDVSIFVDPAGTFKAIGSSDSRISFNSANPSGGILWKGIEITSTSSQNEISYADIDNAGGDDYTSFADFVDVPASIAIRSNGELNLTNSTISNSGGYGMYIRYGVLNSFENNTFSDNTLAGIGLDLQQATMIDNASTFTANDKAVEIYGSTIDESGEFTLSFLSNSSAYYVSGSLDVATFLNIEEGTKLNMAEDVNILVSANGVLRATGSESNKIEFNSINPSSGILWKGIEFTSTSVQNELTHCIITNAGNSNYTSFSDFVDVKAGIAIRNDAKLKLNNTEVSNSGGYGVYVRYGEFESFQANTFSENTRAHVGLPANEASSIDEATTFSGDSYAIEVYGNISDESTWVNLNGTARYNVVADVTINNGLTLNPGVQIDFDEDLDFDVRSAGYLNAEGTSGDPILFTSSNEAGEIAWGGLKFYTSDARNVLDFVTVNLAGGNETTDLDNFIDEKTSIAGNGNARLTLTNSTISNGEGFGVYFQGTINDIEAGAANNTFTNNTSGNVF